LQLKGSIKTHIQLGSLRWFSQRHSGAPHFGRCAPRGAITPKFELCRDFCTMHLPPSFTILCLLVHKLSRWQINKQTDAAENIQHSSLRYNIG